MNQERRAAAHAPAGPDKPERRRELRRETDQEAQKIVEHAVADAPIVHRLLRTGRVAVSMAAIFSLLGGIAGAIGYRAVGPKDDVHTLALRVDSNATKIVALEKLTTKLTDSVFKVLTKLADQREIDALVQCQLLRRIAPDLRQTGCDK